MSYQKYLKITFPIFFYFQKGKRDPNYVFSFKINSNTTVGQPQLIFFARHSIQERAKIATTYYVAIPSQSSTLR